MICPNVLNVYMGKGFKCEIGEARDSMGIIDIDIIFCVP